MAQPSAKLLSRGDGSPIYIASSPFTCVTEAVSLLFRVSAISCTLGISPRKASQLVVLASADPVRPDRGEDVPRSLLWSQIYTWPRTLFFIFGTLPAATKLASLSGVPWTKTLGMTFLGPYCITESITMLSLSSLSAEATSLPSLLSHSSIEDTEGGHQPINERRLKMARLGLWFKLFNAISTSVMLLAHAGLIAWAIQTLWNSALEIILASEQIQSAVNHMKLVTFASTLLLGATRIIWEILIWRRMSSDRGMAWLKKILLWLVIAAIMLLYFPVIEEKGYHEDDIEPRIPLVLSKWEELLHKSAIHIYLVAFCYPLYWTMHTICQRWPVVADVFLLKPTSENLVEERKSNPSDLSDKMIEAMVDPIDEKAWVSFMFFLINLGVCLLWYACLYDQTGTVNPRWTDLFG
ncbi:MAG: hypothetical protein Q9227_003266 [Pyrenula ochraceoflavens]